MLLSFAYLAFSAVLRLLVGRRGSEFAKDVRVARLAPPARSARTASGSSFVPASRSRLPRCARPAPATAASARAERHSPDSSALAPAAGATQVDAAAATSRPST